MTPHSLFRMVTAVDLEELNAAGVVSLDDLRRLYVELAPDLRRLAHRLAPEIDPDDVVQEVFIVALRKINALPASLSARAWLCGVTVQLAATRRRTARLRRFLGLAAAEHHTSETSPLRTLEQREATQQLHRLLGLISTAKREVFVLFEMQGLAGDEIAQALGIPLKTVWTRLFHARKELAGHHARLARIERRNSGVGEPHD